MQAFVFFSFFNLPKVVIHNGLQHYRVPSFTVIVGSLVLMRFYYRYMAPIDGVCAHLVATGNKPISGFLETLALKQAYKTLAKGLL